MIESGHIEFRESHAWHNFHSYLKICGKIKILEWCEIMKMYSVPEYYPVNSDKVHGEKEKL